MDSVANEAKKKMLVCDQLEDKMNELAMNAVAPSTENDSSMRHIRVLENRLDKAMIKYNEAMSIRKTYEQIVKRLKEERVGFDTQLAAIERTLQAKEMAQAELHRFEQGVMEERNQRDKEVQEKKLLVQQRVEMNQRLEQRERMLKKQQADLDRAGE